MKPVQDAEIAVVTVAATTWLIMLMEDRTALVAVITSFLNITGM